MAIAKLPKPKKAAVPGLLFYNASKSTAGTQS
jgi:hypothetical protein